MQAGKTERKAKFDELKLQTHLFNVELKEYWEKLEKDWKMLKANLKDAEPHVKEAMESVGHAIEPLMKDFHAAYDRIKNEFRNLN